MFQQIVIRLTKRVAVIGVLAASLMACRPALSPAPPVNTEVAAQATPSLGPAPATNEPATPTHEPAAPAATGTAPVKTQTVSDPAWGYSVSVSAEWEACTTTGYSRVFCAPQTEPGAPGFPAFYVSVIPAGYANEEGEVYNFLPEAAFQSFSRLAVGESGVVAGYDPAYATFTRLPDTTAAGETWLTIENSRVWEGGPNTLDRRALAAHNGNTYLVGTYYETGTGLDAFEAALATFAFAP